MDDEKETLARVIDGLVAFILWPFGLLLGGYVFMKLWLWFVVPAFSCNPLSLQAAVGIDLMVSFLTIKIPKHKPDKSREILAWHRQVAVIFIAIFVLLYGMAIKAIL